MSKKVDFSSIDSLHCIVDLVDLVDTLFLPLSFSLFSLLLSSLYSLLMTFLTSFVSHSLLFHSPHVFAVFFLPLHSINRKRRGWEWRKTSEGNVERKVTAEKKAFVQKKRDKKIKGGDRKRRKEIERRDCGTLFVVAYTSGKRYTVPASVIFYSDFIPPNERSV
jgi:hypothetical protein